MHQFVNHQRRFDIGHNAGRSNRIKIALDKFSESACLRGFATPYGCNVIAFERRAQGGDVLGCESSQWDGQVKSHSDSSTAVVDEVIHLPVGFVRPFAGKHFQQF